MKQKLELTWAGKDEPLKVEPRILLYDREKSHGAQDTGNILIHGDNLLALKALEKKYAGQVKCIYIDPPYNTKEAYKDRQYDDNFEHSLWLSLIRPRLSILWKLLNESDGSIWISIDDNEQAYMRILCDELFGRNNFIAQIVWQKRYSRENREAIGDVHEYILVYAKDKETFKAERNLVPMSEQQSKVYKNPNNDPKGRWRTIPITAQAGHATPSQFYTIVTPSGKKFDPPAGNCWRFTKERYEELVKEGRIYFGKNGDSQPTTIRYLSEVPGVAPWTWWPSDEVGHTDSAKKEILALFAKEQIFDTPKPETLLQRILHIATNPGDLVLDSFLGSGTTAAVAQKMGRRWIGIEMGDHAYTHCKTRLDKVIDGADAGGVTKATGWQGGGGYRFYELAPTLILRDAFGEAVISDKYNAEQLAAAVALHEGYTYQPDAEIFWKQAVGTEKSYLFTTTRPITAAYLDAIAAEMQPGEFLTIAATSFPPELAKAEKRITLRQIPEMLLAKCAFGVENYNLPIIDPPRAEKGEEDEIG